ncbi:acyl-CoA dehydratase activase-related protein [Anaeroselena agilis]|uniref:Acyl-CoA dehydratase activase-related protein n=1 Tax=Anaeroselena agilis TaxID=3063788 RepID=A0ABU3NXJ3_9FIRM|nr:acyl-CoA dehydratase activase-related protein [Selenomonadales bacterium 4137-cl]
MPPTVGIPRGLLYYYYGDVWSGFIRRLGAEPAVSPETTRPVIEAGGSVDEVCLPVKAFFGHALSLADKVDLLFLPRVVSVAAGHYSCPKIIGLPDIVRAALPGGPPLIAPTVDLRQGRRSLCRAIISAGQALGRSPLYSLYAWQRAWQEYRKPAAAAGKPAGLSRIVLVGHPYILNDRHICMDIGGKLAAMGMEVVTPDKADPRAAAQAAAALPKNIFWNYCRQLAGAALTFLAASPPPDGMIFLTSFACGPDSLVGEQLRRFAGRRGVPFLLVALDEHTAEAGLVTRLEAFTDMIRRRRP